MRGVTFDIVAGQDQVGPVDVGHVDQRQTQEAVLALEQLFEQPVVEDVFRRRPALSKIRVRVTC